MFASKFDSSGAHFNLTPDSNNNNNNNNNNNYNNYNNNNCIEFHETHETSSRNQEITLRDRNFSSSDRFFYNNEISCSTSTMPARSITLESSRVGNESINCSEDKTYEEPTWLKDSETDVCMLCGVSFTFTRRKHHCRICGKIFCGDCTNQRLPISFMNNFQARVCLLCFKKFNTNKTSNPPSICSNNLTPSNGFYRTLLSLESPPVVFKSLQTREYEMRGDVDSELLLKIMMDDERSPVSFILNSNLVVLVKVIKISIFPGRSYWLSVTKGLNVIGQDEMVVILEWKSEENVPIDLFLHFNNVYKETSFGLCQQHLSCSGPPRGCQGGFLYLDVMKFHKDFSQNSEINDKCYPFSEIWNNFSFVPRKSFLLAILLDDEEVNMAKYSPVRLMLRLASQQKCFPYPLISERTRRGVYTSRCRSLLGGDDNDTDNDPPCYIEGFKITLEGNSKVSINIPKSNYNKIVGSLSKRTEMVKILSDLDDATDRHLVCHQNDENFLETYLLSSSSLANNALEDTTATGATFVIFQFSPQEINFKFEVVEDGVVVQINKKMFSHLKTSLRNMQHCILIDHRHNFPGSFLGPANGDDDDDGSKKQVIEVTWVDEDGVVNKGATSEIDGKLLEGYKSIRLKVASDDKGTRLLERINPCCPFKFKQLHSPVIRWLEVYFIDTKVPVALEDDFNLNGFVQKVANICCKVLQHHILLLKEGQLFSPTVRVSIYTCDKILIESGSSCNPLPASCTQDLEDALSQMLSEFHTRQDTSQISIVFELLFKVISLSATLNNCPELILTVE